MTGALPTFERECFLIAPIGDERSEIRKRSDLVFSELAVRHTARMPVALIVLRGSSFVEVDPGPLLGRPCIPQLVPYDYEQSASDFLETTWREFADETEIPRFKYGYLWVLRNRETGQLLYEMGRIWARRRGHDDDWRQLWETGIEPGMRLEAIRPERRAKQHP
jgi:hypothetical protein